LNKNANLSIVKLFIFWRGSFFAVASKKLILAKKV